MHDDTLRAALKVGGRGTVTCPVRSRRIAGGPKGLREGNGPASDTASGRPNAGVSDGNGPEQPADVGPELVLTLGRGGGGEVAAAEVDRDRTAARWGSGGSEGDEAKHGADVGPHAGAAEGREQVGEMPAILAGRVRRELGSDYSVIAESDGVELATGEPQEVGTVPGGAGVDSGRRDRPLSVDVPDKQTRADEVRRRLPASRGEAEKRRGVRGPSEDRWRGRRSEARSPREKTATKTEQRRREHVEAINLVGETKGGRAARASTSQGRTTNLPYWRKCESNEAAWVILSLSMTAKLRASQRE